MLKCTNFSKTKIWSWFVKAFYSMETMRMLVILVRIKLKVLQILSFYSCWFLLSYLIWIRFLRKSTIPWINKSIYSKRKLIKWSVFSFFCDAELKIYESLIADIFCFSSRMFSFFITERKYYWMHEIFWSIQKIRLL